MVLATRVDCHEPRQEFRIFKPCRCLASPYPCDYPRKFIGGTVAGEAGASVLDASRRRQIGLTGFACEPNYASPLGEGAKVSGESSVRTSIRLFQNGFLERFSRTSVTAVIVFWLTVSGAALGGGLAMERLGWATAGLIGAGLAAWMLVEYLLHRFVFHLDRWIPAAAPLCFLIHGCHHADPSDASRDIMPPAASAPMMAVVFGATVWAFGTASGLVFFGAFCLSYLVYDVLHYGCHQWQLPGRVGAYLRRYHMLHHYRDDTRHFGVTSPLWDWVFGTLRLRQTSR